MNLRSAGSAGRDRRRRGCGQAFDVLGGVGAGELPDGLDTAATVTEAERLPAMIDPDGIGRDQGPGHVHGVETDGDDHPAADTGTHRVHCEERLVGADVDEQQLRPARLGC